MRNRGFVHMVLAGILFLGVAAHAAAPARELPGHVTAHISIKSPMQFLESLDSFVSNSTQGTNSAVPPGFLAMMAHMYLPVPLDSWNSDAPAHIILTPGLHPEDTPYVMLIEVDDFDMFVSSLEENDWLMGDPGEGDEAFVDLRPVVVPGGKALVLANLGNGRVAVSDNAARIRAALTDADWSPDHHSDADVFANFSLNQGGESMVDEINMQIQRKKDEIADSISQLGFKSEVARGWVSALEKYIPQAMAEMEKAESIVVELRLDGDRMIVDFGSKSQPGSIAREIADNAGKKSDLVPGLANRVPRGAVSATINGSLTELLNSARQRFVAFTGELYAMPYPGLKDRFAALSDAFFAADPGNMYMGNFISGKRRYNVSIMEANDPDALEKAVIDSFQEANNLWAASIDNPDLAARLAGSLKNSGSQVYYEYQPWFEKDRGEKFQLALDALASRHPKLKPLLKINLDFRIFVSRVDDAVVLVVGDLREEEFVEILGGLGKKAETPLVELPAAKSVLAELSPAQISLGIVDADGAFKLVAASLADEFGASLPAGAENPYHSALEKVRLQNRGEVIGFSLGGERGWLIGRMFLPSESVNVAVRDYEAFERVRKTELRNNLLRKREDEQDPEGDGDDSEEDEEVDEDTEGEPEAA